VRASILAFGPGPANEIYQNCNLPFMLAAAQFCDVSSWPIQILNWTDMVETPPQPQF
jgi:hypothetical protein